MNTNDIRNMEIDQWLFWATALPVTISVIIVGLWWMGELGNAFRSLFRMERSDDYALARPKGGEVQLLPGDLVPRVRRRREPSLSVPYAEGRSGAVPGIQEATRPAYRRTGI